MAVVASILLWRMPPFASEGALRPVPLTTYPGFEGFPSFSPDRQQVAFSWCPHEVPEWATTMPEYLVACNIYVKQIGVEPPFRLTLANARDLSPAWSPDGKWIAFVRISSSPTFALMVIPQRGGRERVLQEYKLTAGASDMPRGPYLDWTPDSQWIIGATPEPKTWDLSLVALDSAENRVLTHAMGDTAPAISPDGRVLVFARFQEGTICISNRFRNSMRLLANR
jgi:Tol biopolymer transport system component